MSADVNNVVCNGLIFNAAFRIQFPPQDQF